MTLGATRSQSLYPIEENIINIKIQYKNKKRTVVLFDNSKNATVFLLHSVRHCKICIEKLISKIILNIFIKYKTD